jgi:NAD(P)H dehydrogenase (quinone)
MRVLVIFAHPRTESYNGQLAGAVRRALERAKHEVVFIDLYREGFDPVLSATERELYDHGHYDTTAVASYVDELCRAEGMVFVFPHWWFNMPAILKGYFDRVWAPGVAFRPAAHRGRIEPLLTNLRKVWVVTTFGSPRWIVSLVMRNPTRRLFRIGLLRGCTKRARFRLLAHYNMDRATYESRMRFIARVERKLARF